MPSKKFYRRGAQIISTATALSSAAAPSVLTTADQLEDRLDSSYMYRFASFIGWGFLKSFFENRIKKSIMSENCKKIKEYFSKCETKTVAEKEVLPHMFRGDPYKDIAHEVSPGKKAGFRLFKSNGQPERIHYFLSDTEGDFYKGFYLYNW